MAGQGGRHGWGGSGARRLVAGGRPRPKGAERHGRVGGSWGQEPRAPWGVGLVDVDDTGVCNALAVLGVLVRRRRRAAAQTPAAAKHDKTD